MCSVGLDELLPVNAAMTARTYLMPSQKIFVASKWGCQDRLICHSITEATNTKNRMNDFYLGPGEKDQAISHSLQADNELNVRYSTHKCMLAKTRSEFNLKIT